MSLSYKILPSSGYNVSTWSGGKTTELYISPSDLDFSKRTFSYRISSATIEDEFSIFSKFNGYRRYITPVEDIMSLKHNDGVDMTLNTFDIDQFMGDWNTVSHGKCVDFNLIVLEDIDGVMEVLKAHSKIETQYRKIFLYSHEEHIEVFMEIADLKDTISLNERDLLIIDNDLKNNIIISSSSDKDNIIAVLIDD